MSATLTSKPTCRLVFLLAGAIAVGLLGGAVAVTCPL
jgi:hypothetical protein